MHFQKFISSVVALTLVFSLSVGLVPAAFASSVPDDIIQPELVDTWANGLASLFSTQGYDVSGRDFISMITFPKVGKCSYDDFISVQYYYNTSSAPWAESFLKPFGWTVTAIKSLSGKLKAVPVLDKELGVYRLKDSASGKYIVDLAGRFPYVEKAVYEGSVNQGSKPAPSSVSGKFRNARDINWNQYIVESEQFLLSLSNTQNVPFNSYRISKDGKDVDVYVVANMTTDGLMVYCNSMGIPYVAYKDPGTLAAGNSTTNNYTQVVDKTTNSPTYNQTTNIYNTTTGPDYSGILMDINNGVLNIYDELGNLDTQDIYNVSYDYSDHSYNVTTYNTTYNTTNNHYEYNYYTYNIKYTYNNTYVTYIGSTAEYQPKEWELYYELPDGRSSADLTEEDVAGLSFQFADCINYKKSATDTRLRALYHFDGNVNDVSYFSDKTSFTWNTGASITYMESNAFGGALYLDEKEHKFTITLPSNIGSGDFTLQWRYYQNNAAQNDHNENYVTIDGQKVLGWSEQYLYNGSGTQLASLSIGTWQELALVRNNGTLYIYHNGVNIGSVAFASTLSNTLVFYFGPNSRGYSMLDEMRFVKGALYTSGEAYTPTAVPYDTNQVLVLPDSPSPVVDAHWNIDSTYDPSLSFDFINSLYDFLDMKGSSAKVYPPYLGYASGTVTSLSYVVPDSDGNYLHFYHHGPDSYVLTDTGLRLESDSVLVPLNYVHSTSGLNQYLTNYYGVSSSTDSAFFYLNYFRRFNNSTSLDNTQGVFLSGSYTVTVLFSDGTSASAILSVPTRATVNNAPVDVSCDLLSDTNTLTLVVSSNYTSKYYDGCTGFLVAQSISFYGDAEIAYLEFVPGTEGNNHEYITAVYDSEDIQPNTAAIQTDIPINGYTVGGVRPTFPVRGDVWFPVEGSRISGVQIYNGQAWEQTNARWWTGSRWIPIYAFDLVTLADMWDISSSEGADVTVTPPITSESGFWNWWRKAWNDFTNKLFGAFQPGSGGSGSDPDVSPSPSRDPSDYDTLLPGGDSDDEDDDDSWNLFDLLIALKDGIWAIVKGVVKTVFGGIKGVVSVVTDIGGFFTNVGEITDIIKNFGG